jgi:hypothetical protein
LCIKQELRHDELLNLTKNLNLKLVDCWTGFTIERCGNGLQGTRKQMF